MIFLIYWLPPILWMWFIFPTNDALSIDSTSRIIVPLLKWLFPEADPVMIDSFHILVRKILHFLEYSLLAFLLFRAFRGRNKVLRWSWIIYAGIITIGYSSIDEFMQTMIASRTGSFSDWMIDAAGIIFALGVIAIFTLLNKKVLKQEGGKLESREVGR